MTGGRQRWVLAAGLAAALSLAVACGGDPSPAWPRASGTGTTAVSSTAASAAVPTTSSAAEPPSEDGCPPARTRIGLRTRDGVDLSAVAVGRGSAGVVLLHESDGTLCNWWPYAWTLAGRGLQVVAVDL